MMHFCFINTGEIPLSWSFHMTVNILPVYDNIRTEVFNIMGFFKRPQNANFEGGGLVIFNSVEEAIAAEKVLKAADYIVRLVAPPPELRKGCDLAIEINLTEQLGIERLLKEKTVAYVSIDPITVGTAPLLEVVKITDFGKWLMVKAGNMKLTYEKDSGIIVNISGGGCPDIPYMYAKLMDKRLDEAPHPKDIGFTLCALNLERALDECLNLNTRGN
jgi:hypothetical protein